MGDAAPQGGVQSVGRVLDVFEAVVAAGGESSISEIALACRLPVPTIHRLVRTVVDRGYMRQLPNRRYALGSRLVPLGEAAGAVLGASGRPVLEALVAELGESANLAVLERDRVTYIEQVPSHHAMRMFTEVGRRVYAHCTGVGKAVLSLLPDDQVRALVLRAGMPAQTPRTITDPDELVLALHGIRRDGFAIDEGEQEAGVRCVAVPVQAADFRMAVSVSGPDARMTPELVMRAVPLLTQASRELALALAGRPPA
ncbi:MAG: IclR family transcriptional regulator [Actinomycetota bacterium]|nr:IclR family transcriptional regulator [Actinomycetota bacterium]